MNATFVVRILLCVTLQFASQGLAFAQEEDHSDPLALDAKAIAEAGIVVDALAPRAIADELKVPGEVRADAYSTVVVSPRVEVQVVSRSARLGERVKAGQPLVRLSSVQVAETQGALIVAEQDWQRIAALGPQAVSARRYNEAKVQRDQARAKLRAYGVSYSQVRGLLRRGSVAADGSFELLAPIDGRVTSDEFLLGERIEPGHVLFTLVREDSVWVVAQMTPSEAERIKADDSARIVVHEKAITGTVIGRAHQSDERTRTVPVRIAVDNHDDLLHPGDLVEAWLTVGDAVPKLAIPADAVVLLQNQASVFLVGETGAFEPTAVKTGETRNGWTVIREGMKEGDRYVRKGAFALKARLLRSQLGEH